MTDEGAKKVDRFLHILTSDVQKDVERVKDTAVSNSTKIEQQGRDIHDLSDKVLIMKGSVKSHGDAIEKLERSQISKAEFERIKKIVDNTIWIIVSMVLIALLGMVIVKHTAT